MLGVAQGFTTIAAVVAIGWVLAHRGVLDWQAGRALANLAFFVASPALLLTVLARAPVSAVVSAGMVVALTSALLVMAAGAGLARWRWRLGVGDTVQAALCAGYVNSGNLGLPIALYVLGDVAYAAPVLLVQLLLFTPLSLAVHDAQLPDARVGLAGHMAGIARNPITLGAMAGLVLSLGQWRLPALLMEPITLLGNLAVPCMLVAFGVSLRLGQRPGQQLGRVATLSGLKLVAQPMLAAGLGVLLGLRGHELYAVVVMAALPTAQNIFTYALRYDRAVFLTRDTIFVTTFGSVPAIFIAALVFHGG